MKNKVLLTFFLLISSTFIANAAYFRFQPYQVVQPDGTAISCFVSGDEYFNWLHDKNGYTIIQADDGYFYYGKTSGEIVVPTFYLVNKTDPAKEGLSKWAKISLKEYNKRKAFYSVNVDKSVTAPHLGTLNNIVIYIHFNDDPEFTTTRQIFDNKFNPSTGNSLKSYYTEVSYNTFSISSTHYPDCPMTTNLSYQDSHNRNYFQPYNATTNPGGYNSGDERTSREHSLLRDAVAWIDANSPVPEGLNIDGDDDGKVDNVCFIIEGSNGAWADLLWAHRWALYSLNVFINGKRVYDYTFQPQTQVDVNTLCHEMYHALGSPDLYHYSYDGLSPVGDWDLMESGRGHMGAFMKWKYANSSWITSIPSITKSGIYSLKPLSSPVNNCYQIASPNDPDQFFVVEYRKKAGIFEGNLPGSGLLVYRIDPAENGNASGPPDEVYIYRQGGTKTSNGNPSIAYFSSESGRTAINDGTNPAPFLQDGSPGGLSISKVTSAGDSIFFTVNLSTIHDPSPFTVAAVGTSQNNLNWKKNNSGDKVMLAYSLTPVFGFPDNGINYPPGTSIPGGGTVIYNDEDTLYNHTGLNTNTTYYYTAWSVTADTEYSPGAFNNATTFCDAVKGLPFTENFEESSDTLNCWTQSNADPAWVFITGNGPNPGHGFPANAHSGTRNALLKDLTSGSNLNSFFTPVLDLSGYTDVQLKFWLCMKIWASKQDELKVYYRNNPEGIWILLHAFVNSVDSWTEETIPLTTVSSQFQLAFEGNAKYGFGVCLDDIEITGTSSNTLNVSPPSQNVTPIAGSTNFTVTSNTRWTSSSDASWCTVTPSGDGTGEIIAVFTENPTTASRTANIIITVGGLPSYSVAVVQRGKGVSVQEITDRQIRIFPNPSKGTFSITSEGYASQTLEISILDLTGSVFLTTTAKGEKENLFDLSRYPQGIYFVKVKTGDNVVVQRLVIAR